MDETEVRSQLEQVAGLPLEDRADRLDALVDRLEAALEETSAPDPEPGS